jgi:hypothetical protein
MTLSWSRSGFAQPAGLAGPKAAIAAGGLLSVSSARAVLAPDSHATLRDRHVMSAFRAGSGRSSPVG